MTATPLKILLLAFGAGVVFGIAVLNAIFSPSIITVGSLPFLAALNAYSIRNLVRVLEL